MRVVPDSVPQELRHFLLAIVALRVAALYERKIWVVRGLWIITGLLWTATIIIAIFTIKSFYSQFFSLKIVVCGLQRVYREFCVRYDLRNVPASRCVLQTFWNIFHTISIRYYYCDLDNVQDISPCDCSKKGVWCSDCMAFSVNLTQISDLCPGQLYTMLRDGILYVLSTSKGVQCR